MKIFSDIAYNFLIPFYHIRAKERAKYATLLHCRTGQKYGLKRSDKMAAQNEPNVALFTSSDLDFLTDELFTVFFFYFLLFRLCCLCLSRAYYAIDTMQDGFRKLKAKILENGGMVE